MSCASAALLGQSLSYNPSSPAMLFKKDSIKGGNGPTAALSDRDSTKRFGLENRQIRSSTSVTLNPNDPGTASDVEVEAHEDHDEKPSDFAPSKILFIEPHNSTMNDHRIWDFTQLLTEPFDTKSWREQVKTISKTAHEKPPKDTVPPPDPKIPPYLVMHRPNRWKGWRKLIDPVTSKELGSWKGGFWSSSPAHFTFPAESPHCGHALVLKPSKWYKTNESFVLESVLYEWENVGRWSDGKKFHLKRKGMGGEDRVVAQYRSFEGWRGTGGALTLREGAGVDEVVVLMTLCGMLRKRRQRDAERSSGGG